MIVLVVKQIVVVLHMLKKQIKFIFKKTYLTNLCNKFLAIFGTIWLFIESASFFLPEQTSNNRLTLLVLAVTSASILSIASSFPRLSYSKNFRRSNVEIAVQVGSILEKIDNTERNVIIGINNSLIVNKEELIGNQSLRSQIINKFYQGKSNLLDKDIANSLSNKKLLNNVDGVYEVPIGSVGLVKINKTKIFFLINKEKRFDKAIKNISKEDFWLALCNLWEAIKNQGYNHPVVIPVLGSGLGRAPASRISLIQLILTSFAISNREFRITSKLTLMIYEKDYDPEEVSEVISFIEALDL